MNAISWLQFFAPKSTRKKLCEQMLSSHRHRQDKKPKCCSNCPNPGRGCRASPHFSSARFAHFSRIPHFLRIPHFSPGFSFSLDFCRVWQIWRWRRCGERSAVHPGLFICAQYSISIAQKHNAKECKRVQNNCSAVHQGPFRCPTSLVASYSSEFEMQNNGNYSAVQYNGMYCTAIRDFGYCKLYSIHSIQYCALHYTLYSI